MATKGTVGFTKSAQKVKFIRNRDLKLKDKEQRKENEISRAMCEGICNKCREKAQWRFKFNKYKPLKSIGNCQNCKRKTVTKAYRTLCDKCATEKHVCASCCRDIVEANSIPTASEARIAAAAAGAAESANPGEFTDSELDEPMEEDELDAAEFSICNDCTNSTGEGVNRTEDIEDSSDSNTANIGIDLDEKTAALLNESIWNERRFQKKAVVKYAKDRKVGEDPPYEAYTNY